MIKVVSNDIVSFAGWGPANSNEKLGKIRMLLMRVEFL